MQMATNCVCCKCGKDSIIFIEVNSSEQKQCFGPRYIICMDSHVFSCLLEISFCVSHLCWAEEVEDNMRSREWKETRSSDEL